jgi:hypothetical protein
MQFATISEAFGVDSLENNDRKPAKRTAFGDKIFGEDIEDADAKDVEPPIMVIPEDRKITQREVREFLTNTYRQKGIRGVWNMFDLRIKRKLLGMCNKQVNAISGFFEDLFTSPEKMLAVLAVLFVVIILLDVSKTKVPEAAAPRYHPAEQMYYQQPQQYYYSVNPISTG